ncbi:MAG: DNA translocase FtsK [candidate division KSB1 bacterium]|nr:DNA translocase FtsK [candidate division KSB1 bacterium]
MRKQRQDPAPRNRQEAVGLLLITFGLLLLLAMVTFHPKEVPGSIRLGHTRNAMGFVGAYLAYYLIRYTFGYAALAIPLLIVAAGWNRFRQREAAGLVRLTLYLLLLAVYASVLMALPAVLQEDGLPDFRLGGSVGVFLAREMLVLLGLAGTVIVLFAIALIAFSAATQVSLAAWFSALGDRVGKLGIAVRKKLNQWRLARASRRAMDLAARQEVRRPARIPEEAEEEEEEAEDVERELFDLDEIRADERRARIVALRPVERKPSAVEQTQLELPVEPPGAVRAEAGQYSSSNYQFPPLSLLLPSEPVDEMTDAELRENARLLEQALLEFNVQAKVVEISPGPVITRYEVEPAPGVKIAQILSLSNDLARMLRARSIRIVAPIPGKAAVGIEIPNRNPAIVRIREILESREFQESPSVLTIALGRTVSGKPYVTDLAKMPHLLVAGATGSGKSVCLNAIITSILYKARPDQVQFVLIDPKRLELSLYAKLRDHHLNYVEGLDEVVITTPANAITALRAVEYEMQRRYELFAHAGVRSFEDYDQKVRQGEATAENGEPFEPIPRLVVIVDELADLMLTAAKEVEEPIARLAHMSRAVGIHLVLATQRPSVDVLTGVIKANFPVRIAFRVFSKTDSRTILDMNGAEKLLGRGDMLFVPPGSPEPIRVHGAYVSTEESEALANWVANQPPYPKEPLAQLREQSAAGGEWGGGERDPLFEEAARLVVRHQQGSISLLQRRLKIGYSRAARIIDELEEAGIVGPFDGSKAREVLVDEEGLMAMGIAPYGD